MATIKDVAREAGVSIATVSRVFNDSGLVSPETERAVREVASRLNYWPNGVARSLITNRTHTVGVLLPDLHGEFFSGVIRGLDATARRAGFHLLVSSAHSDVGELAGVVRSIRGRIDGLVVMAPDIETPAMLREWAGDTPIVLIDPRGLIDGFDTIGIANVQGASAMVQHLIRRGHRRIAIVTGPERNVDAAQRLEGYREAVEEAGLPHASELEVAGDFTEPSGYQAMRALLGLGSRPTAVFVANDHMAVGAMRALAEAAVPVPDAMAVAGFDDIETARYLSPPLSTVHVDRFGLGARALERLLQVVRSGSAGRRHVHELLRTTLVIRRSCGGPVAAPLEERNSVRASGLGSRGIEEEGA